MSETKSIHADVVVVGAGFAGIRCAVRLAEGGADVCLLEENTHLGGQLLRRLPQTLGRSSRTHGDKVKRLGMRFLAQLKQQRIRIITDTAVYGVYPDLRLGVNVGGKKTLEVTGRFLVLATGARERFFPFPGWTLPGVMSAGMVQVLIKSSGVLPSRRTLVGGSGLFLLSAAHEILSAGGQVAAVLQDTGLFDKIRMLPAVAPFPVKWSEGIRFAASMARHLVPCRFRTRILSARGGEFLQQVVVARTDHAGRVKAGTEKTVDVDTLAVGYGFIPNIELAALAGCRLDYRPQLGGWVVNVSPGMETSIPRVFAAGEPTGVAGALKSILEGDLAALRILELMGRIPEARATRALRRGARLRARHERFGTAFNELFRVSPGILESLPDDTVVCRCEDITMGEIRRAVADGYHSITEIKTATRATMGACQGRTCAAMIQDILTQLSPPGKPETPREVSIRPPARPVRMGTFTDKAGDSATNR